MQSPVCTGIVHLVGRGGSCSARTQRRLGCMSGPRVQPEPQNTAQTLQGLLFWVRTSATQAYRGQEVTNVPKLVHSIMQGWTSELSDPR